MSTPAIPADQATAVGTNAPVGSADQSLPPTSADHTATETPELAAQRRGAELMKLEGSVFVRVSGMVETGGLQVPYRLVPPQGVLAKPSKWRKLTLQAQIDLVRERVTQKVIVELQHSVQGFVGKMQALAEDAGLEPMTLLGALADNNSAEPAAQLFERIGQRVTHAIERQQEERHAALTARASTWPSIRRRSKWRDACRAASSPCSARPIPARRIRRWKP